MQSCYLPAFYENFDLLFSTSLTFSYICSLENFFEFCLVLIEDVQRRTADSNPRLNCIELQVIAAEGEMNASRKLKEAADVMSESPNSMQLRYLQTLTAISAEKNSTIIFPLPIDMLNTLMKK